MHGARWLKRAKERYPAGPDLRRALERHMEFEEMHGDFYGGVYSHLGGEPLPHQGTSLHARLALEFSSNISPSVFVE